MYKSLLVSFWKQRKQTFNIICVLIIFAFMLYSNGLNERLKQSSFTKGVITHLKNWSKSDSQHLTTGENYNVSVVNIVLWVAPKEPPAKSRLDRMKGYVETMNSRGSELCSGKGDFGMEGAKPEFSQETCHFSISNKSLSGADAVVFFMFNNAYKLSELPNSAERTPEQLWVMYAREPPYLSGWRNPYHNLFNWTMSYRSDSNVWTPYGKKISSLSSQGLPISIGNVTLMEWIAGKTKLAAGVISNCNTPSQRRKLISLMRQTGLGAIDIFGKCGNQKICGRYKANCTDFWGDLAKKYKFYLAFENSLCKDYITEKFWRTLEVGMVPVVYGGGDYELEAPPKSYVNVKDFSSVENLMKYLVKLDSDKDEYAKYFEWRRSYKIQQNPIYDWCDLFRAVQDHKRASRVITGETYENLKWWWQRQPNSTNSICEKNPFRMLPWMQTMSKKS